MRRRETNETEGEEGEATSRDGAASTKVNTQRRRSGHSSTTPRMKLLLIGGVRRG
jgi:hypothetical protein